MNRILTAANFIGVVALAVLCGIQWRTNSRLTEGIGDLDRTRTELTNKVAEQDKQLASSQNDLADVRQRLDHSDAALKQAQSRLDAATAEKDRLAGQQKQFKSVVDQWAAAVAQRDQIIQQLGKQKQEAVLKFNDLVGRYNAIMKKPRSAAGMP